MLYEELKKWADITRYMCLLYLEAHFNKGNSFFLTYGAKVVVPIDVTVLSAHLARE